MPPRHQILVNAPASLIDGTDPDAVANIIGGGPLLLSELEYLACNAELFGSLFDPSGSQVLWHGRGIRTVTDPQWRALLARDQTCRLCDADCSRCEAHHLIPWTAPLKGETNIDNLVLLCVACHKWLHANNRTMFQKGDGTWATRRATKAETPAKRSQRSRQTSEPPPRPDAARRAHPGFNFGSDPQAE